MKSLTILLALFVLIGCQNGKKNNNPDERLQEKEVPDNFDIGEAKDGRYTNNYFNLSFEYDQEWDVLTYEELESLMDMGVEVSSQSNKKLKKSFEAAKVRTAQHFGAFKHDPETFTGMFNPSVLVLSENVTMHDIQYQQWNFQPRSAQEWEVLSVMISFQLLLWLTTVSSFTSLGTRPQQD